MTCIWDPKLGWRDVCPECDGEGWQECQTCYAGLGYVSPEPVEVWEEREDVSASRSD